jgi:polyisoprenoid-binding protein YceI
MLGRAAPVALLSLLLGSLPPGVLGADVPASGPPDPDATSHAVDARRSGALFLVRLRGRTVEGRMPPPSGALTGSAATGWVVRVEADGRGLRVEGPRWMERATRSDAFLAVNRHPRIRFESTPFEDVLLQRGGAIAGHLTLRGLRQPVSFLLLPSECARPGLDCDLQVHGRVSRKAFGMSAYRVLVRDEVDVRFRMRLREATP